MKNASESISLTMKLYRELDEYDTKCPYCARQDWFHDGAQTLAIRDCHHVAELLPNGAQEMTSNC
jgi:hypothetical protein